MINNALSLSDSRRFLFGLFYWDMVNSMVDIPQNSSAILLHID